MRDYVRSIIRDERGGFIASLLRILFWLGAIEYGFLVRFNNGLYDRRWRKISSLPRPVVSVGNITWGGTGKTPLIQVIAQEIVKKGFAPAVLLRGYMPVGSRGAVSDEADLLRANLPLLPVIVGKNRYTQAQNFLKDSRADIFLMDDGFQHRRLARDLDIVVLDATNPFGNRDVLPAGILREPMGSLRRADIFVLTKCDLGPHNLGYIRPELSRINPAAAVAQTRHAPVGLRDLGSGQELPFEFIKNKSVAGLCAIGDPQGFSATLQKLGARVGPSFVFPDHHVYGSADITRILKSCRDQKVEVLVTTEKDAVKLQPFQEQITRDVRLFVLRIRIEFLNGKEQFFARIFSLLQR